MSEREIAGYVIATLTALAAVGGVFAHCYSFKQRWNTVRLGGLLVRFEDVIPLSPIVKEITAANNTIRACLKAKYPTAPALQDYRVIVRPVGKLPTTGQGGTEWVERMLPFLAPVYIAVVQEEHVGQYICHEVARHVVPRRLGAGRDMGHDLVEFAELESEMKHKFYIAMRSV